MLSKEELTKRENLCIHEEPAYCVAACPLKLDAKGMVAAVASGDFSKALTLYEKITPFAHLLSAGCEAPCEGKCKLNEAGEGIFIRGIERAVAKFGEKPKSGGLLRFKKKKTAALFGSGLFMTFLAGELAKKAYPLTVYARSMRCGFYLGRDLPGPGGAFRRHRNPEGNGHRIQVRRGTFRRAVRSGKGEIRRRLRIA
jgi:NADPH-dependent glutamate synthase beta subunit-like oxidoreductase